MSYSPVIKISTTSNSTDGSLKAVNIEFDVVYDIQYQVLTLNNLLVIKILNVIF